MAVIFGIHRKLLPNLQTTGGGGELAYPVWFPGSHGHAFGDGMSSFATSVSTMVTSMSSSMSSAAGDGGGASAGGGAAGAAGLDSAGAMTGQIAWMSQVLPGRAISLARSTMSVPRRRAGIANLRVPRDVIVLRGLRVEANGGIRT